MKQAVSSLLCSSRVSIAALEYSRTSWHHPMKAVHTYSQCCTQRHLRCLDEAMVGGLTPGINQSVLLHSWCYTLARALLIQPTRQTHEPSNMNDEMKDLGRRLSDTGIELFS